jgi:serine phosphatase RsbU (regulator of sigma subunit)
MNRMSKTYLIIVFSLFLFKVVAQSQLNDSLKVISYADLSHKLEQTNTDSSIFYAKLAYKLAYETNSDFLKCRATALMGTVYQNVSDYKKATAYFKDAVTMSEKGSNKELRSLAYTGFANMFALQGQFEQAAEYFNKSLVIAKEIKDNRKIAAITMNLANIEYNHAYYSLDFTKCNQLYNEAYNFSVLSGDTSQIISCLGNWGLSYSDEEKFDLSLEKLNKAIELAYLINDRSDLIFLNYYLGRTYGYLKEYQKAISSFKESLKLAIEFKDLDYQSENYGGLATTYYDMGNYKEAYDLYQKYKAMDDSLTNKEIVNELNAAKVKYDTEKKQKEIELLKVNANKNRIVNISLIVGAVLLLLLILVVLNRYRLKAKTHKLLESQNAIISEKNKDISDSINYAKKIQDAILPSVTDIQKVFPESFVMSIPKDVVSGDFYWFAQHQKSRFFVVADCTGHGVPGALMSMIGNTLLNSIVNERKIHTPNIILNELRKEVISVLKQGEDSQNKDGMDISLCRLNTETNVLEVACANNPIWILKNDGELIELKPDKQPIGYASNNSKDFSIQTIELSIGDTIYQFTDGFADQFGGVKGKKFKYNQLKEILVKSKDLAIFEQKEMLNKIFAEWKGDLDQIDDVLVTGIRIS